MTTAGRPTWNTAKGGKGRWENDLSAMSKQYSARDLPSHTKLKVRQDGQGNPEELRNRDFKRALEDKERRLAEDKSSKTLPALTGGDKHSSSTTVPSTNKRSRPDLALPNTSNLDMDDPWDEDYNEDDQQEATNPGDSDVEEEAEDDDDEDEELLLAELAKIKRERQEEANQLENERKAAAETIRMENILKGNPLLNATANNSAGTGGEFKVKRRWDHDVVFKNCARGEIDHAKRGFVNDTLRSEFHQKFMRKYIQ